MKIDIMLHCDRFGVHKCRFLGPCWGRFLLLGAPSAAKIRTSRTATPFLLIFESVQKMLIFEEVERSIQKRFFGPKRAQGTKITPRRTAKRSSSSPSWDLGSLGTPRARQGLIKINQGLIKQGLLIIMEDLTRLGPKAQRIIIINF